MYYTINTTSKKLHYDTGNLRVSFSPKSKLIYQLPNNDKFQGSIFPAPPWQLSTVLIVYDKNKNNLRYFLFFNNYFVKSFPTDTDSVIGFVIYVL